MQLHPEMLRLKRERVKKGKKKGGKKKTKPCEFGQIAPSWAIFAKRESLS